jgi:hypothetical protein
MAINEKLLKTLKELYTWESPVGISYTLLDVVQLTDNISGENTYRFDFKAVDHNNKDKTEELSGEIDLWSPVGRQIEGKQIINIANQNKRVTCRYTTLVIGSMFDYYNKLSNSWILILALDTKKGIHNCYFYAPMTKDSTSHNRETYTIDIVSIFKYFNITDVNDIGLSSDPIKEEDKAIIDNLKTKFSLDEKTVNVIKYINRTSKVDEKLTASLVSNIAQIWNKRKEIDDERLYNPLDFDYMDYYDVLTDYLLYRNTDRGSQIKSELRSDLSNHYKKDGKISLVKLQARMGDLIKGSKSPLNDTNEVMAVNPAAINSQENKILFKRKSTTSGFTDIRLWTDKFVGLVDPVFTSDNSNVASKNLLCKDADFNDGDITITLLTPNFSTVKVPLEKYCLSGVLSSDNIDYTNKKIVPDSNGEYTIYKYGHYIHTKDKDEIDYLRRQDGVLCDNTANMPFINKSFEMRGMLAAHMINEQAVPTLSSVPDILYTGVGKEIYKKSSEVIRAPEDGTITLVNNDMITYKNSKGESKIIPYEKAYKNAEGTGSLYRELVKPGDKIKKDEPIVESVSFKNENLALQIPLLTAFTDYEGYTHEDAVVLSYSAAQKLGHSSVYNVEIPLFTTNSMLFDDSLGDKYDNFGIIKENTVIDGNTRLLMKYMYQKNVEELDNPVVFTQNIYVPKFIKKGFVYKVSLQRSVAYKGIHTDLDIIDNYFKQKNKDTVNNIAKTSGSSIDQVQQILPKDTYYSNKEQWGKIIISIVYINNSKIGDKITSRYGAKGVIGMILPDEEMYKTKDGRTIDILMSALALYNRQIISQLFESSLTTISKKIFDELAARIDKIGESTVSDTDLKSCIKDIYFEDDDPPTFEELYKKNKSYGFVRIHVAAMDKHFTKDLLDSLDKRLGIEEDQKLFIPKYNRWTKQKVRVVYQSFYRLKFFAEKKLAASGTSTVLINNRDPMNFKSISGYGHWRPYAKIGEQETSILKAYGEDKLLARFNSSANTNEKSSKMLSNLLVLSLSLKDNNDDNKDK